MAKDPIWIGEYQPGDPGVHHDDLNSLAADAQRGPDIDVAPPLTKHPTANGFVIGWGAEIPVRIFMVPTDNESVGDNRWKYSWQELRMTASGTWTSGAALRAGTLNAYNRWEVGNTATGTQGCGVVTGTSGNPPANIELGPVVCNGKGVLVIDGIGRTENGEPIYWFSGPNMVKVTCL